MAMPRTASSPEFRVTLRSSTNQQLCQLPPLRVIFSFDGVANRRTLVGLWGV